MLNTEIDFTMEKGIDLNSPQVVTHLQWKLVFTKRLHLSLEYVLKKI